MMSLRWSEWPITTKVVVVCAFTLFLGYMLKAQCLGGFDGRQYSRLCYNDIQPLFGPRLHVVNAQGNETLVFPYINGSLTNGELTNGAIEYPVLTGLFMWLVATLTSDGNTYLILTALFLAPCGLLVAFLLSKMSGARAFMWAAAPPLVFYAFHNWDLLVVAASVFGFYLWWQGRPELAAVLFGVGAAFKLYPIFFLAPLVLDRWAVKEWFRGFDVGLIGAGTFALIQLPFALASWDGWWATYGFHTARGPNYDDIWTWPRFGLPSGLTPEQLNLRIALLTVTMFVAALVIGWVRRNEEEGYPFVQVCAAMLAAFLLWSKVHSPQYALWILPFFVLLRINVVWWVLYLIFDAFVYVGVFRYFYDFGYAGQQGETLARGAMIFGVWARAALLAVLFIVFLSTRSSIRFREGEPEPHVPAEASA